ncbi:hypothetical protein ASC94_20235 [Massilia sp. Root418]|uniref:hypothetical protein n=1 Tax=Massilia sp. Root418 TaxID=1736532 RepID=UPI0006FBBD0A|nr:hypothetical protein [Massilia sp. Root418]KQW90075.1 hypothetical protein ASC94_20235 [Massilia sp. Root418]
MHKSKKFLLAGITLLLIGAVFDLYSGIANGSIQELLTSAGFFAMAGSYILSWPKPQIAGQQPAPYQPNKPALALSLAGTVLLLAAFGLRRGWF